MALTTIGGGTPMAAAENLRQLPQSHNYDAELIVPRHGVVTLFGYGIQVRVDRGHLLLEDGIGTDRRYARLPRVGHGLKRLVVTGSDGMVARCASLAGGPGCQLCVAGTRRFRPRDNWSRQAIGRQAPPCSSSSAFVRSCTANRTRTDWPKARRARTGRPQQTAGYDDGKDDCSISV